MEETMITAGRSAIRKLFAVGLIGLALMQVPERATFAASDVVDDIQLTSGYEVVQEGTGLGRIGITGEPSAEYDFVFRITESGVLGEAAFIYSPDGGNRWSETIRIPLSGFYALGTSGLTAEFWLSEEEVFLNGESVGVLIMPPYKLTLSADMLKANNTLEIRVTGSAANEYKYTKTFEKFAKWQLSPYHDRQMVFCEDNLSAGLFGPVKICF